LFYRTLSIKIKVNTNDYIYLQIKTYASVLYTNKPYSHLCTVMYLHVLFDSLYIFFILIFQHQKHLTKEPHEMINSDFNEILYRLYKKMNLENVCCDGKTIWRDEITLYVVKWFFVFSVIQNIRDIKKYFIQKLYNKITSIHLRQ